MKHKIKERGRRKEEKERKIKTIEKEKKNYRKKEND